MIIQASDFKLCKVAPFCCLPVDSIARTHFLRMSLHVVGPAQPFLREASSQPGNFSVAPAGIRDSNVSSFVLNNNIFVRVRSHVECIPNSRDQEMMLVRTRSSVFHQFLPHGSHILLLSNHFYVIHKNSQK